MNIHENLRQISNLIKKHVNQNFEELGLTFSQSGILMYILLNKNNNINQRDIENEFKLSNPTVNGILNRLENKGLVRRVIDDTDKRVKHIIPLKKSEKLMEIVKQKRENLENNMIKNINNDELITFNLVLEKMIKNIKESTYERNI